MSNEERNEEEGNRTLEAVCEGLGIDPALIVMVDAVAPVGDGVEILGAHMGGNCDPRFVPNILRAVADAMEADLVAQALRGRAN